MRHQYLYAQMEGSAAEGLQAAGAAPACTSGTES